MDMDLLCEANTIDEVICASVVPVIMDDGRLSTDKRGSKSVHMSLAGKSHE